MMVLSVVRRAAIETGEGVTVRQRIWLFQCAADRLSSTLDPTSILLPDLVHLGFTRCPHVHHGIPAACLHSVSKK